MRRLHLDPSATSTKIYGINYWWKFICEYVRKYCLTHRQSQHKCTHTNTDNLNRRGPTTLQYAALICIDEFALDVVWLCIRVHKSVSNNTTHGNYATRDCNGMRHLIPQRHLSEWREEDEQEFVHRGSWIPNKSLHTTRATVNYLYKRSL